jgi:hypothetical protein
MTTNSPTGAARPTSAMSLYAHRQEAVSRLSRVATERRTLV